MLSLFVVHLPARLTFHHGMTPFRKSFLLSFRVAVFSRFSSRLASDNRKLRENSCFSNSLKVKQVGKFQYNSH